MQDSLKEHIEQNRESFDLYPFKEDWEGISRRINPEKKAVKV
jgi:hypothetical protein